MLSGLVEGTYAINVSAEGFSGILVLATLPSASPEPWTFRLDEEATLRGRVLDSEGDPVVGGQVYIGHPGKHEPEAFRKPWRKQVSTDWRGFYRLDGLPSYGEYCLLATDRWNVAFTWIEGILPAFRRAEDGGLAFETRWRHSRAGKKPGAFGTPGCLRDG